MTMTTLLVTLSLFLHVGQGVAVLILKVIFSLLCFHKDSLSWSQSAPTEVENCCCCCCFFFLFSAQPHAPDLRGCTKMQIKKKEKLSVVHMSVIPALGQLRQEDHESE